MSWNYEDIVAEVKIYFEAKAKSYTKMILKSKLGDRLILCIIIDSNYDKL